jgi:hypothetical protein
MGGEEQLKKNEPFVSLPKEVQENYKKAIIEVRRTPLVGTFWSPERARLSFPVLERYSQLFKNDLEPFKKGKSFAWAMENVFDVAEKLGEELGRSEAFSVVRDIVWKIYEDSLKNVEGFRAQIISEFSLLAVRDATRYASLALVSDKKGFKINTYRFPKEIYTLGLVPKGFKKQWEGKKLVEKFMIAIPLEIDDQHLIGYFKEGSKDLFFHNNFGRPRLKKIA